MFKKYYNQIIILYCNIIILFYKILIKINIFKQNNNNNNNNNNLSDFIYIYKNLHKNHFYEQFKNKIIKKNKLLIY